MNMREDLHKSGEDYLEAVLILTKQKGRVRSIDVAEYLNFSKPSICNAVSLLRKSGYLEMNTDHFLFLTKNGRAIAEEIYERHCFFTELLESVGVDHKTAEADACAMEHDISSVSFKHLEQAIHSCAAHRIMQAKRKRQGRNEF